MTGLQVIPWNGKPISEPGIYQNVPIAQYHSGHLCVGPSISSSGLRKIFGESPMHYWDGSAYNPNRAISEDSEAFILGRAAHHLFLGEPFFSKLFVIRPDEAPDGRQWNGNNLTCKKWLAARAEEGRTVLTSAHVERIKGMALALGREPLVQSGALNGIIEATMAWQDKETGVWLLARPDVIPTDDADFIDLKSAQSVDIGSIVKSIGPMEYGGYAYNQQGALVCDGYKILTGRNASSFSLYFVESKRPHCCNLVQMVADDLHLGSRMNKSALLKFVKGMNSGHWPGPNGDQAMAASVSISDRGRTIVEDRLRMEGL